MKLDLSEKRMQKARIEQQRDVKKLRADFFRQHQINRAIKRLLKSHESAQPRT